MQAKYGTGETAKKIQKAIDDYFKPFPLESLCHLLADCLLDACSFAVLLQTVSSVRLFSSIIFAERNTYTIAAIGEKGGRLW